MRGRVDIRAIFADPVKRREMAIRVIVSAQAMEGIETTPEQAAAAYDKVQAEPVCHRCPYAHRMPTGRCDRRKRT